jgi:peptide/nickel transport system permease protein
MTSVPVDPPAGQPADGRRFSPVLRTVLQRLGLGLLTLFLVSILIFVAIEALPGDFARAILGQSATFDWIGGLLQGDFGVSFASAGSFSGEQRTVLSLVLPRLYNTLLLAGVTALIAIPLSLGLGLLSALYRNSWFDRSVNVLTLAAISVPEFFVAYVLMLFLAVKVHLFHAVSMVSSDMPLGEQLERMALPVLTLVLGTVAHMMRMTRAAVVNVLANPYVEMARLKGLRPAAVIFRHALPNAWAPIVTIVALYLAYLIAGVVVVEVVFVYPGIGQLMVDAVTTRDVPVVQACALIFATVYILLNLFADIVGILTNPRLLHP